MQQFNNNLGFILIETDKTTYSPEDKIIGKIYLQVNSQHVEGQKLFLKIEGSQYVESQRQDSNIPNKGKQIIYDNESLIQDFNEMYIPQGKYEFPFELVLGINIPGSMEIIEEQQKFSCKIQYKFIAKIKDFAGKETSLQKEEILIIKEKINEMSKQLRKTIQPEIKEWCFFNKGHTIFTASIKTNQFTVGESCEIEVQLNNANCDKDIRHINVKLINNITLQFNNGQKKQIQRMITQQQQVGMAAKTFIKDDKRLFELPIADPTQNQLYGTVNGSLIRSSYLIQASIEINMNCFNLFTPFVELPITIFTKNSEQQFRLPPNWKSSKFENKVIDISKQIEPIDNIYQDKKEYNRKIAQVHPNNSNIFSPEIVDQNNMETTQKLNIMTSEIMIQSVKHKNTGELNK